MPPQLRWAKLSDKERERLALDYYDNNMKLKEENQRLGEDNKLLQVEVRKIRIDKTIKNLRDKDDEESQDLYNDFVNLTKENDVLK